MGSREEPKDGPMESYRKTNNKQKASCYIRSLQWAILPVADDSVIVPLCKWDVTFSNRNKKLIKSSLRMRMPVTSRAGVVKIYIFIYESPSLGTLLLACFPEFPEQKRFAWNYCDVNPSITIDKQKAKETLSFLLGGLFLDPSSSPHLIKMGLGLYLLFNI